MRVFVIRIYGISNTKQFPNENMNALLTTRRRSMNEENVRFLFLKTNQRIINIFIAYYCISSQNNNSYKSRSFEIKIT